MVVVLYHIQNLFYTGVAYNWLNMDFFDDFQPETFIVGHPELISFY